MTDRGVEKVLGIVMILSVLVLCLGSWALDSKPEGLTFYDRNGKELVSTEYGASVYWVADHGFYIDDGSTVYNLEDTTIQVKDN